MTRPDDRSTPSARLRGPTDGSTLLALDSAAAQAILGVFVLTNVVFTVATLDRVQSPWPSLVAMVLVSAGGVIVMRPTSDPFPMRDTLVVVGIVVASTALVSWQLDPAGGWGRETWHLGSNQWLLFLLTLRRRVWWAWLGLALMFGVTLEWCMRIDLGALQAVTMLDTQIGMIAVSTLFAANLRRTARRINDYNHESVAAATQMAATEAGEEIRRQRVAELAASVVPLLERIAAGAASTEDQRREYRAAEAALRDQLRGRSLALPAIVEAIHDARMRGVDVVVLDDRGPQSGDGDVMESITQEIVSVLDGRDTGTVTIRLLPAGRTSVLSIVAQRGDDVQRVWLGTDGQRLSQG